MRPATQHRTLIARLGTAGFLFFLVTVAMALPGALVLAWEGLRRPQRPSVRHG